LPRNCGARPTAFVEESGGANCRITGSATGNLKELKSRKTTSGSPSISTIELQLLPAKQRKRRAAPNPKWQTGEFRHRNPPKERNRRRSDPPAIHKQAIHTERTQDLHTTHTTLMHIPQNLNPIPRNRNGALTRNRN